MFDLIMSFVFLGLIAAIFYYQVLDARRRDLLFKLHTKVEVKGLAHPPLISQNTPETFSERADAFISVLPSFAECDGYSSHKRLDCSYCKSSLLPSINGECNNCGAPI